MKSDKGSESDPGKGSKRALSMLMPKQVSQEKCEKCGADLSEVLRYCPACEHDAGTPNVRRCCKTENKKAIAERYRDACQDIENRGCQKEFAEFEELIKSKSGVVVAIDPTCALSLLKPTFIYNNYESLVDGEIRVPAKGEDDRIRRIVGGTLFGSYANRISYGALSLTDIGLSSYGSIHCRLRSKSIKERTSFLEKNSYAFFEENSHFPCTALNGRIASWEDRHLVVLAKLAPKLKKGQKENDWQRILVHSDGDKKHDDCVEAHIYGSFTRDTVDSLVRHTVKKPNRDEEILIGVVVAGYNAWRSASK